MNRSESPLNRPPGTFSPTGEKDGMRGYGSWEARRLVHLISKTRPSSLRSSPDTRAVPTKISDLHIASEAPLPPPRELHEELPVGETEAAHIARSRSVVGDILLGKDERALVVVGPCSIHEPESALEYARRLGEFSPRVSDALF